MKTVLNRRNLFRFTAVGLSLALCATATACVTEELVDPDEKQPPDVEAVWDLNVVADTVDPVPTQAVADGDELFVWGHVGPAHDEAGTGLAVFALATGEELWESPGEVRSAWVAQGAVVVETQGKVQVLDRASGEPRFEIETAEQDSPIAATADGVAVLEEAGDGFDLVFYDLDSGDKQWSEEIEDSGYAMDESDDVYVSAPSKASNVHGLTDHDHRLNVVQDSLIVYAFVSGEYVPYSVADGDRHNSIDVQGLDSVTPYGFMTVTGEDNVVTLVDQEECKARYAVVGEEPGATDTIGEVDTFDVEGGPKCRDTTPSVQESYAEDTIYGLDYSGHPKLVDANTGQTVWTAPEEGTAFAFADGVATYGSHRMAKAVDVESGKQLWSWDYDSMKLRNNYDSLNVYLSDNLYGSSGDVVFLGGSDTSFGIDGRTGEPLWSHRGAIVDFSDDYVVLARDLGIDKQIIQVSKIDG